MEDYVSDQVAGTCLAVGAALTFASIALVVTVDTLPVLVATEARFFVCWVMAVLLMLRLKISRGLYWFGPPGLRRLLFTKAALSFSWVTLWWNALRRAPMGDCITIVYCGPILTSLWSAFLLGNKLPRYFIVQTVLVSSGMLLIVDPPFLRTALGTGTSNHNDYTFVLIGLVVNSFVPIVTRQTRKASWIEVEHVVSVCSCLVFNPCLFLAGYVFENTIPTLPPAAISEAGLIVVVALGTFVGVAMETRGYQLAEPGKAAMFRYVEVPYAYFLQHMGTSTPVASRAIFGAILIITSCIVGAGESYRTYSKERTRSKQMASAATEEPLLHNGSSNGNINGAKV